ncbi:hypothetical protein L596_008749 [Steinernema carpocapsae]|uniref:Uncharacterized protein n=1 Tax=Steinernema carpocapsae TaxID=34508 RepID=A0A4U5PDX6_STECR|nr:hypothetical protein L596_008749 [Steinernema carpocapsae]
MSDDRFTQNCTQRCEIRLKSIRNRGTAGGKNDDEIEATRIHKIREFGVQIRNVAAAICRASERGPLARIVDRFEVRILCNLKTEPMLNH